MQKSIAIWIDGGLGKVVSFSACLSKLKEKYSNVIVISNYPEVFIGNPFVDRNLTPNQPYLYEDYLKDILVIKPEPYLAPEYRFEEKHIIEAFSKLVGIEYSSDMLPQIYLLPSEEKEAINYHNQIGDYILLQITGGTSYYSPQNASGKVFRGKDYPAELAQAFVAQFRQKYANIYPGIKIVQIGLEQEAQLSGVINMCKLPSRLLFPLVKYCKSYVLIDSCIQHVAASFDKKGVVLFGGTSPKRLGYANNTNLVPESLCKNPYCHRSDFYGHLGGKEQDCAYNYSCMTYSPEHVLDELSKILDNRETQK